MLNRLRLGALWTLGYASLAIVLVVLYVPVANAQTQAWNENVLVWTAHTTCTDGAAATNCPVAQWRIETAATATAATWDLVGYVPAGQLTYLHTGVTAGQHCYRVKGVTADSYMTPAGPMLTNSCKTNTAPRPNPPGAVTVTNVTAYEVRPNSSGVMVASRIGIVPAGTACSQETRTANAITYNRIAAESVDLINWPSRLPPTDVFARCAAG